MTLFLYLGKVMLSSAILYGYYRLFLRNKQFHHYNRFYLLSALLVSIVLPFIKIPFLYEPGNAVNEAVYQTIDVLTVNHWEDEAPVTVTATASSFFTLENVLYIFYITGIAVVLTLIVKSLLYIKSIRRRYSGETINYLKFYNTKEPGTPFSFFRSIFWNEQLTFNSREGQQIFRHEVFHVQQKHSADILLAEIVTALFWYNPVFYLIKKEIKAIHEFLADQYAASGSDRYAYAELLVKQTLEAKNQALSNHFFQNHIKRRIAMITQFQKSRYGYWSRVMVLPVSILLFCAFSLYAQQQPANKPTMLMLQPVTDEPLTIIVDPGHGGTDPGALSYEGDIKEKDIALQISRQLQQLAPDYKINVVLTRSEDILPGNARTTQEGLRERTNLVGQTKAAAFISIHASAAPKTKQGTGFEVFITNKNGDIQEQSRKLGMSIINSVSGIYTTKTSLMQRKEQGIWVLDQATCPAVIVECGYITNSKDVAFVTDPAKQQLIAKKILEAVLVYKNSQSTANQQAAQPSMQNLIHTVSAKQVESNNAADIDIEKVRTLKHDQTTLEDVKRLFGEPVKRAIAGPYEEWYYTSPAVQFGLNFNIASNKLVAFYYKATNKNNPPITYAAVKSIKENVTTAAEVKKLFGEPTELFLAETGEGWFYKNEKANLQVQFLAGKKTVMALNYAEEDGKQMRFVPSDTIPVDTVTVIDVKVNKQVNENKQVNIVTNVNKVNKQIKVVQKVNNVNKQIKVNKNTDNHINVDTSKPLNIKTSLRFETKSGLTYTPSIKLNFQSVPLQINYKSNFKFDLHIKTDSMKIYQPQKIKLGKPVSFSPDNGVDIRS